MKKALIECPKCNAKNELEIPKDKCLGFFKCSSCNQLIFAQKECCVICQFSEEKCPVSTK